MEWRGEDDLGLKWLITYNMIDSRLNTFYDVSDGKICIVVYLFDLRGNNNIKLVKTNPQSSSNKPSIFRLVLLGFMFLSLRGWWRLIIILSKNFTDILTLLKNSFYNHRMLTSVSLGLQNSQLSIVKRSDRQSVVLAVS